MTRNLTIFENCNYFKIYTGPKSANTILVTELPIILQELEVQDMIDKWFFIRYVDPHHHIRLRIFGKKAAYNNEIQNLVFKCLKAKYENKIIWKINITPYKREIERYGIHIEKFERLFMLDSKIVVENLLNAPSQDIMLRKCMIFIKKCLDSNGINLKYKVSLLRNLKDRSELRYSIDRIVKKEISFMSRMHNNLLAVGYGEGEEFIFSENDNENKFLIELNELLTVYIPEEEWLKVLGDVFHMHFNRLFMYEPNKHEYLIYELLYRHMISVLKQV